MNFSVTNTPSNPKASVVITIRNPGISRDSKSFKHAFKQIVQIRHPRLVFERLQSILAPDFNLVEHLQYICDEWTLQIHLFAITDGILTLLSSTSANQLVPLQFIFSFLVARHQNGSQTFEAIISKTEVSDRIQVDRVPGNTLCYYPYTKSSQEPSKAPSQEPSKASYQQFLEDATKCDEFAEAQRFEDEIEVQRFEDELEKEMRCFEDANALEEDERDKSETVYYPLKKE